jgi:hypothetical protein
LSSETRSPVWQQEQGVVAASEPGGAVGSGQQRVDLDAGQEAHDGAIAASGRDAQHPTDLLSMLRCAQCRVAEQGVDRGQSGVAGGGRVGSLGFQVLQKRCDQWCVQVGDVQLGRLDGGGAPGEAQQQPAGQLLLEAVRGQREQLRHGRYQYVDFGSTCPSQVDSSGSRACTSPPSR